MSETNFERQQKQQKNKLICTFKLTDLPIEKNNLLQKIENLRILLIKKRKNRGKSR